MNLINPVSKSLIVFCAMGLSASPALGRTLHHRERQRIQRVVKQAVDVGALSVAKVVVKMPRKIGACSVEQASVPSVVAASGEVAVQISGTRKGGKSCDGWVFASVKIYVYGYVATKRMTKGADVAPLVSRRETLLKPGMRPLATLPLNAVARRVIAKDRVLQVGQVRLAGPATGTAITVELRKGALRVSQRGVAIACAGTQSCARLPSGRRVSGTWHGNTLLVEMP